MAKGKKTGGRNFEHGHPGMGGRPRIPDDLKLARLKAKDDFERALYDQLYSSRKEITQKTKNQNDLAINGLAARYIKGALESKLGDARRFEFLLEHLMGKPKEIVDAISAPTPAGPRTFTDFCEKSGYPKPFMKQIEMMDFGLQQKAPRLLLGARGYGKTDYITILGVAYKIYLLGANYSFLVVTKEKKRASAILNEISHALTANGIELEKSNSSCVRVKGRIGSNHSVEGLSVKSGFRGRHPDEAIMDDPVTEEDVSEATRELVDRKYSELLKLTKNVLIIGQPAHKEDLYAKLRPLLLKMEVPHGTIPELDHDLAAMMWAGIDSRSVEMSYHLRVPNDGTNPFDKIRYIDKYPIGDSVAFIDPSFEGGDYTAITILRGYGQGVAVVGFAFKKAWNHCLPELVEKITRYGVRRVAFETNSLGDQPILLLRNMLPNGVGVVGIKSNTNKHSRIMAAGSFAPMIHLAKESDRVYIDQVVKYEYKAKHDDCPDSLASALSWLGIVRGKL